MGAEATEAEDAATQDDGLVEDDVEKNAAGCAEQSFALTEAVGKLRVVAIEEEVGGGGVGLRASN